MQDTTETPKEKRVITPEIRAQIEQIAEESLNSRRPTGSYREDGILPLGGGTWVQMSMATRENLIAWSAIEQDPENLRYIISRLEAWDKTQLERLEWATLANLERVISAINSP